MLKKAISILILTMYVHGMIGYTMSIHKCMMTGSESVYTTFGNEDPCKEEEKHCDETITHFEEADCCDLQQTVIAVDDESNISSFQVNQNFALLYALPSFFQPIISNDQDFNSYLESIQTDPPDLTFIGVFRI